MQTVLYELPFLLQTPSYTFKITQSILQITGKPLKQIQNIIATTQIQNYYIKKANQDLNNLKIFFMCLQKQKEQYIRYNQYNAFTVNLLNQIAHVQFYNTITLNINSNELLNIEAIQYLNAPKLELLQLYGNKIINIGAFVKNNTFQNLMTLTLYQNKINDLQKLSRGKLRKLQYILIQTQTTNRTMVNNIWFVIKIQSQLKQQKTKRLWCSSSERIRPKNFKQQIYKCRFV